jgi:hypothetical protein
MQNPTNCQHATNETSIQMYQNNPNRSWNSQTSLPIPQRHHNIAQHIAAVESHWDSFTFNPSTRRSKSAAGRVTNTRNVSPGLYFGLQVADFVGGQEQINGKEPLGYDGGVNRTRNEDYESTLGYNTPDRLLLPVRGASNTRKCYDSIFCLVDGCNRNFTLNRRAEAFGKASNLK